MAWNKFLSRQTLYLCDVELVTEKKNQKILIIQVVIKSQHTLVHVPDFCDIKKNETKINKLKTFSTIKVTYELYFIETINIFERWGQFLKKRWHKSSHQIRTKIWLYWELTTHVQTHAKCESAHTCHDSCSDWPYNKVHMFQWAFPVVTSYSKSHRPQRAFTASEWSHCSVHIVGRRVQRFLRY